MLKFFVTQGIIVDKLHEKVETKISFITQKEIKQQVILK